MSKRWLTNFLAVCTVVLIWAAMLILGGCASVHVEKTGEDWDITYNVLFRDIKEVHAVVGDLRFDLGSASTDLDDTIGGLPGAELPLR